MLSAYIVCLLAGGVVLGASMFGGHDSDGGDAHVGDAHGDGDHDGHHEWAARLPFLSLRFWTWGVTFFGLAGVALTLGGTPASLIPVLAAAGGVSDCAGNSQPLPLHLPAQSAIGDFQPPPAHRGWLAGRLSRGDWRLGLAAADH
jgi:hypothetical protein